MGCMSVGRWGVEDDDGNGMYTRLGGEGVVSKELCYPTDTWIFIRLANLSIVLNQF